MLGNRLVGAERVRDDSSRRAADLKRELAVLREAGHDRASRLVSALERLEAEVARDSGDPVPDATS